MKQYKDLLKEFNKEKYSYYLNLIKNKTARFNPYLRLKYKKSLKQPKAPDISTITEHIAFVIDGQVVEIIHCQPKMAAILLSEPLIVQIPEGKVIKTGWSYENGTFIQPEQPKQQADDLSTFKDYLHRVENNIEHPPKILSFKEFLDKLKERV